MFVIRFAFYFTISFAILCIPIGGGRQLFDKIFSMVTPYARDAAKTTKQKFTSTKRYSKKLYSNSEPTVEEDEVKSKMAATERKKNTINKKQNKRNNTSYSDDEEERLRRALSDE